MSKSNLLIVRAQLDDLPDSLLVGMRCDSAVMHFQDGTSTRLANQNGLVSMTVPASTPDNPVGWLSGKFSASADTRLTFVLNRTAANALQRGVRSIDVFGRVVESQPHVDGSLPLHAGAQLTRDGARIRIVRIVHTPDSLNVTIRMHSLAHAAQPMAWLGTMTMAPLEPRFALVNARRGAAMPLFSGRGSGGASWLVLPGAPLSEWESDLVPGGGFGRQEWTPDDAWYRGAQLVAIRWDSRASYQVHGSIVGGG
jgi:hypothetical protein